MKENGHKETEPIEVCLRNMGTVNKNVVILNIGLKYVKLYFSYKTIVAVDSRRGFFVSENDWSKTTGKLLNELEPDKKARVEHKKVLYEVQQALRAVTTEKAVGEEEDKEKQKEVNPSLIEKASEINIQPTGGIE